MCRARQSNNVGHRREGSHDGEERLHAAVAGRRCVCDGQRAAAAFLRICVLVQSIDRPHQALASVCVCVMIHSDRPWGPPDSFQYAKIGPTPIISILIICLLLPFFRIIHHTHDRRRRAADRHACSGRALAAAGMALAA